MRYRFSRVWAYFLVVLGVLLLVVGAVGGIAMAVLGWPADLLVRLPAREGVPVRVAVAVLGACSGLLVGGALIVAGQLMLSFLDLRQLLVAHRTLLRRIRNRLDGRDRSVPNSSEGGRGIERLRPRR